jgi:hypothetical protein
MRKEHIIFFCESCRKPLAHEDPEPELKERGIDKFAVYIKEGSFARTNEEQLIYLQGHYCSLNCLLDRITNGIFSKDMAIIDEFSYNEFLKKMDELGEPMKNLIRNMNGE